MLIDFIRIHWVLFGLLPAGLMLQHHTRREMKLTLTRRVDQIQRTRDTPSSLLRVVREQSSQGKCLMDVWITWSSFSWMHFHPENQVLRDLMVILKSSVIGSDLILQHIQKQQYLWLKLNTLNSNEIHHKILENKHDVVKCLIKSKVRGEECLWSLKCHNNNVQITITFCSFT